MRWRFINVVAKILCLLLILSEIPMGVFAETVSNAASSALTPNDSVSISIKSDGTHEPGKPETFIQTKNGFKIGDDTSDDRVVTSGDYVTYEVSLNIVPGP